jgi:hypothetical protein
VTGEPPSSAGAVQVTVAEAPPGTTVAIAGAPGTVAGVTASEAAEPGPVPTAVTARTRNR